MENELRAPRAGRVRGVQCAKARRWRPARCWSWWSSTVSAPTRRRLARSCSVAPARLRRCCPRCGLPAVVGATLVARACSLLRPAGPVGAVRYRALPVRVEVRGAARGGRRRRATRRSSRCRARGRSQPAPARWAPRLAPSARLRLRIGGRGCASTPSRTGGDDIPRLGAGAAGRGPDVRIERLVDRGRRARARPPARAAGPGPARFRGPPGRAGPARALGGASPSGRARPLRQRARRSPSRPRWTWR